MAKEYWPKEASPKIRAMNIDDIIDRIEKTTEDIIKKIVFLPIFRASFILASLITLVHDNVCSLLIIYCFIQTTILRF